MSSLTHWHVLRSLLLVMLLALLVLLILVIQCLGFALLIMCPLSVWIRRGAAAVICSKSEACGTISTMQWLQPFGSLMTSFLMLSLRGRPRNLAC